MSNVSAAAGPGLCLREGCLKMDLQEWGLVGVDGVGNGLLLELLSLWMIDMIPTLPCRSP